MTNRHADGGESAVRYQSPAELGKDLFDRTVDPGMTFSERMRAALLAGVAANKLWDKYDG